MEFPEVSLQDERLIENGNCPKKAGLAFVKGHVSCPLADKS